MCPVKCIRITYFNTFNLKVNDGWLITWKILFNYWSALHSFNFFESTIIEEKNSMFIWISYYLLTARLRHFLNEMLPLDSGLRNETTRCFFPRVLWHRSHQNSQYHFCSVSGKVLVIWLMRFSCRHHPTKKVKPSKDVPGAWGSRRDCGPGDSPSRDVIFLRRCQQILSTMRDFDWPLLRINLI